MHINPLVKTLTLLSMGILLSGCSILGGSDRKEKLAYVERPAEQIYTEGYERMERNDWNRAKLFFQKSSGSILSRNGPAGPCS